MEPEKTFKSIDSYTGEEKTWASYDEYIASFKNNNFSKLARSANMELIKHEPTVSVPTTFNSESYEKSLKSSSYQAGEGKESTKMAGTITSKSLDEVIKEKQSGITGNVFFDAGFALGQLRNQKVQNLSKEYGSFQNYKASKKQKRDEAVMRGIGKVQTAFNIGEYGKYTKTKNKLEKRQSKNPALNKMQPISNVFLPQTSTNSLPKRYN